MRRPFRFATLMGAANLVLLPLLSLAGFAGTDLFLPMVGRQAGVYPSNWYTTVWVHNPGLQAATARIYFLERGTANPSPPWVDVLVGPGDTEKLENVVEALFQRQAYGALRVTCGSQKLVVTSRVYSKIAGQDDTASMGQDFAGVPASFAIGLGERTQVLGTHQTVPAADSEFRFNFGFVETTGSTVNVRVSAYDDNGAFQGSKDFNVREYSQRQVAFKDHFPSLSTDNARLEVEVISGGGRVIAYGSMIANGSQDPTTFEMTYSESLLAASAPPGITGVTAGAGLAGGGTSGTVTLDIGAGAGIDVTADTVAIAAGGVTTVMLANEAVTGNKIADGAVAPEHIDTTGAAAGQVLKVGSPAHWADDGITLPFLGSGAGGAAPFTGLHKATMAISETDGSGAGVWATSPCVGVVGTTSSDVPIGLPCAGVFGWSATRPGVSGQTGDANSVGVSGINGVHLTSGTLGSRYGVHGDGRGSAGVVGESYSHRGVWGKSTGDHGIYGETDDAGHAAMIGDNHGSGTWGCIACGVGGQPYGGYFGGKVAIDGDLSCTGCVSADDIANGAVTENRLAPRSVGLPHLKTVGYSGEASMFLSISQSTDELEWKQAFLVLPYTGAVANGQDALTITNAGGAAITGSSTLGGSSSTGTLGHPQYGVFGSSPSTGVRGEASNGPGVVGESSTGSGVYGQGQTGHGVSAASSGGDALHVFGAGRHGLMVEQATDDGIHVASASHDGVEVSSAGWSGVYVASAGFDALRVQSAGQDGLRLFDGIGRDYIRAGDDGNLEFRVTNDGAAFADGGWQGAADFAELVVGDTDSGPLEPGDVLVIGERADRTVARSTVPYSTLVAGVYSTKPGFVGSPHPMSEPEPGEVPVALVGIVPCKVSAENGPIRRGDLLVTAATPGHAMRADDPPPGTVVAKALQEIVSGAGVIEVLVSLM